MRTTTDPIGLSRCEHCHRQSAGVIETRHTGPAVRRRKQCRVCNHRFTTYELSAPEYLRLTSADSTLSTIFTALNQSPTPPPKPTRAPKPRPLLCTTCPYNTSNRCSFDYPEYNTRDADDCVMHPHANS